MRPPLDLERSTDSSLPRALAVWEGLKELMFVERGARTAVGARLALRAAALADWRRLLSGRGGAAVLG